MSVTTRNVTGGVSVGYTMTAKGSVSGAKTTVYFVFDAEGAIFGAESTSDFSVYVDGTKKSLSWTVNKTENWMGRPIVIKATSATLTVNKPFFMLKIEKGSSTVCNTTFSFYDIEKAATSATAKGGVMNGTTNSTVTFTTSSTDATYKATFSLGTYSGSATSSTKTVNYKIPKSWCNALPNKSVGTATVTCEVLYGGSVFKTITTSLSVSVPDDVVPTITSVTLADKTDTPVPSSWNAFIQHQSGLRISAITCAGAYGSTIKSIRIQVGDQMVTETYNASNLPQIDTVTQSGSLTCTVTVMDSRYRYGTKTATVSFLPYAAPAFSEVSSERCDASGEKDNDGTYFLSTTEIEYSSCNGLNSITLKVSYKRTDAPTYGSQETITPGVNVCGGGNLNTEYSYDVRYVVSDQFSTVEYIDYVSTAVYLMHFLHGGRGVAFGQKATMQDYLDCNFKALFRDDVFVTLDDGSRFNLRALMAGAISTLLSNVTADRAIVSNADGKLAVSPVTATELGYLGGVTSNIQDQIAGIQAELYDSGWKNLTLSSNFVEYSSTYTPKYRRVGEVVDVVGAVKPTAVIEGSTDLVTIFTLPSGFRPKSVMVTLCQGPGAAEWMLHIATNGTASFARHRGAGAAGYTDVATSAWLPFHATFLRA